jgi:hypothetical protein
MAEFKLNEVIISYEGEDEAIASFHKALKEQKPKAIEWLEENGYTIDTKKKTFSNQDGDVEAPDELESLVHEFTDITFFFDLVYWGDTSGGEGNGRYFCVFENGVKVYDANGWLEELRFLNWWAQALGFNDVDFYKTDEEEMEHAIAKGMLLQKGKKRDKISDEDIDEWLESHDFDGCYDIYGMQDVLGVEFLWGGENYSYMSRVLTVDYDGDDYGIDHYRDLREGGELPSLNACHRGSNLLGIKDIPKSKRGNAKKKAGAKTDIRNTEEYKEYFRNIKDGECSLEEVPEKFRTEDLCKKSVMGSAGSVSNIEFMPEAFKTPEFLMEAVKDSQDSGSALEYVPEALRTAKLCMEAVKEAGSALEYVPEALRTEELCIIAAKNAKWDLDDVLKQVPKALKAKVKKAAKAKG